MQYKSLIDDDRLPQDWVFCDYHIQEKFRTISYTTFRVTDNCILIMTSKRSTLFFANANVIDDIVSKQMRFEDKQINHPLRSFTYVVQTSVKEYSRLRSRMRSFIGQSVPYKTVVFKGQFDEHEIAQVDKQSIKLHKFLDSDETLNLKTGLLTRQMIVDTLSENEK